MLNEARLRIKDIISIAASATGDGAFSALSSIEQDRLIFVVQQLYENPGILPDQVQTRWISQFDKKSLRVMRGEGPDGHDGRVAHIFYDYLRGDRLSEFSNWVERARSLLP